MSEPTLKQIELLQERILAFIMQLDSYPPASEEYARGERNIKAMEDKLKQWTKAYGGE